MATRYNRCPVPSVKVSASAGWFGGARVTGLSGFPRTTGFQVSSGSDGGAARGAVTPGVAATVSAYVRTSFSGTLTARINWYKTGAYLSQQSDVGFSVTSGTVRRINITATPPSGADQALLLFPSRSGTVVVTAVLIENGSTLGSYFDGDTSPGGSWDGTDGASTSTLVDSLPPTVSAGPDLTGPQFGTVAITATENGNGSAITSRAWTVVSGPAYVGTTLATAAALSWRPETPGAFVLRYSAANSSGTGSDDVAVTVTEVVRTFTAAPAKLAATLAGAKTVDRALTSTPLRLTAASTGGKVGVGALTATPLRLAASWVGARNLLPAPIKLAAAFGSTSTGRTAPLTAAALHLGAALTDQAGEKSGTLTDAVLRLTGALVGERILAAVRQVPARPSLAITHELVVVARVPQALGPPALIPVDAITWSGLSWTDELSKPQTLNAGCKIDSLTEEIKQRLRTPKDLPSELWLYRHGRLVFAGPLVGGQVQGQGLSLTARGLLYYLDYMQVDRDLVFRQVDQTVMATTMVDQWQSLDYGHFGIDTSAVPASGVLRDGTYLRKEQHPVGKRVAELGARIRGYDLAVDPASRQLVCAYPHAGIDRSSGEDAIVFDKSNITSPNIVFSAAPGDIASEVYGSGTSTDGDTVFGVVSNPELRARFGRTATSATFDGVKDAATLTDHLTAMRDARNDVFLVPGPDTSVTADSDLSRYDAGDTVAYAMHEVLSVSGAFRLLKRQVTASKSGTEAVSVAFV